MVQNLIKGEKLSKIDSKEPEREEHAKSEHSPFNILSADPRPKNAEY
jgi:hypothetical protein